MDSDTLPLFSQINLNRSAHLRDSKQLLKMRNCFHLLIWRGKLLFRFNDGKPIPYLIEKKTKFIKKSLTEIICSINQVLASFLELYFTTYAKTFNGFLFGRQRPYGNGVCRLFSVRNNSNYLVGIFRA